MSIDIDFRKIIKDAGIPVDEATMIERFRSVADDEKLIFNNTCSYSPFWRLVSILIAKPLLWIIDLLAIEIFPALFLYTAKGKWVDVFAWQLNLERKPATKALGVITFRRSRSTGEYTIPANTLIQSNAVDGNIYRLNTLDEAKFIAGQVELQVICEAEEAGAGFNLSDGFYAILNTELQGIVSVYNDEDWLLRPGADEENDDDLKQRCRNQFGAVNMYHIDQAYIAMITRWPGIDVSDVYLEKDAPRGPGTANAYILFDHSLPVAEYLNQIHYYIMVEGNHGFSDNLRITEMPTRPYNISANILLSTTLNDHEKATLTQEIENFIRVALRDIPNATYKPTRVLPQSRFAWSILITELHEQFGGLRSIDFTDDNDIITEFWIPEVRSLTINSIN